MDRRTGHNDITEILLKMELNTIQSTNSIFRNLKKEDMEEIEKTGSKTGNSLSIFYLYQ